MLLQSHSKVRYDHVQRLNRPHFTHHKFGETCVQLLHRGHGGAELQQLKRHAVLQVDLQRLAAAKAAQEAQARPRPLPGGHGGTRGDGSGSGGAGPGGRRTDGAEGQGGGVERRPRLLSRGHDLEEKREEERGLERSSVPDVSLLNNSF